MQKQEISWAAKIRAYQLITNLVISVLENFSLKSNNNNWGDNYIGEISIITSVYWTKVINAFSQNIQILNGGII
jgi:hypothetical protein